MNFVDVVSLIVTTFGVLTFGALSVLVVRERRRSLGAMPEASEPPQGVAWIAVVMSVYTTLWFLLNLIVSFRSVLSDQMVELILIGVWAMSFLYPPLIMHMQFIEHFSRREGSEASGIRAGVVPRSLGSGRIWWTVVAGSYVLAAVFGSMPLLHLAGLMPDSLFALPVFVLIALFMVTAVYSVVISIKTRPSRESSEEKSARRWHYLFWLVLLILFPVMMFGAGGLLQDLLGILSRCFPLLFVFVTFYYLERFVFFDIFVKRGMFALFVFLILAIYFSIVTAVANSPGLDSVRTWLYALTFLPLALPLPWIYTSLGKWLDRVWLRRRFSPTEAMKFFVSGLEEAMDEEELFRRAEARLSAIFQAEVCIRFGGGAPACGPAVRAAEIPLKVGDDSPGVIHLGRRKNQVPFFSTDRSLLTSLADMLSHLIQNIRLQKRRQEQEKREKELEIHASRSELKALRAQINPHFLFNALNAIAGLVHVDPDRAEQTVEQLAEIFRYTLRGSDKEWATLQDEIDFVRAYLDVEKSRFGERLKASVELERGLEAIAFPVMMIQTLVENAVKHGVAGRLGEGFIQVSVRRIAGGVRVEVADNGHGPANLPQEAEDDKKGMGYGLRNVEERLSGYYGERARFELGRDDRRSLTVAAIEVPYEA